MRAFLPDQTRLTRVHLRTANLGRAVAFYSQTLQLVVKGQAGPLVEMASGGDKRCLLAISEDEETGPAQARAHGLGYFALRYPTREDLAQAYLRLLDAGIRLCGATHDGVSESLYLTDPDGNNLELCADRPRSELPRGTDQARKASVPLDPERWLSSVGVSGEAPQRPDLGHIHLQVSNLAAAEQFYSDFLGLSVTQRSAGALFLAAGNDQHHLVIRGHAGDAPANRCRVGMVSFRLEVPIAEILYCLKHRAPLVGYRIDERVPENAIPLLRLQDPDGTWVEVQPSAHALGADATSCLDKLSDQHSLWSPPFSAVNN